MATVTICSDFGAQEKKSHCLHSFPIYLPWRDGTWCHDLSFLNIEFQANFITLLFYFHQEALQFLFVFCPMGGVTYISEVIDISPSNLDSSFASFSLGFLMMYSAETLNKQADNIQPWRTPFPIWNQPVVPCSVLLLLDLHTDFSGGR